MKKIVILNGSAKSGKDTFADVIIKRSKDTGGTYAYKTSTVDEVKKISKFFGVKLEKTDKERRLWSDLKDAWTRYNNGPFNDIIQKTSYFLDEERSKIIYIVMCREPEEIAKFKQYYKDECVTVLIKRPNIDVPNNHADMNVDKYNYDCEIHNNASIENFIANAQHFTDTIFD